MVAVLPNNLAACSEGVTAGPSGVAVGVTVGVAVRVAVEVAVGGTGLLPPLAAPQPDKPSSVTVAMMIKRIAITPFLMAWEGTTVRISEGYTWHGGGDAGASPQVSLPSR